MIRVLFLIQEVSKGSWKKHGTVGKWSVQVQDHRPVKGRSGALVQKFCVLFPASVSFQYCSTSLQFQAISQYLPRGDLRLRPAIYEMILHEFLKTDYEVLRPPPLPIVLTSCDKSSINPIGWSSANFFPHFLCCPQRVSPHWSVNGPESFIITWPLFRRSLITWRRTPLTGPCSPRWLNCEWSEHVHYWTHQINIEGNIQTQVVSF